MEPRVDRFEAHLLDREPSLGGQTANPLRELPDPSTGAAFSPDGRALLLGSLPGVVLRFDLA